MKLIFSSELGVASPLPLQIGFKHYSYKIVAERFFRAFSRSGTKPSVVPFPESIKHPTALRSLLGSDADRVVHIAFRSTEEMRPIKSAYNICQFFWEFDVLKDRGLVSEPVTLNQTHMLNLFDEVWVSCRYTRDILHRYGMANVHVVPVPICDELPERMTFPEALETIGSVPSVPLLLAGDVPPEIAARAVSPNIRALRQHDLLRARLEGGRIFLTVCNPNDLRKNLLNIIEGFQIAAGRSSRDLLILKLIVPNRGDFRASALQEFMERLQHARVAMFDPRVVFVFDYLDTHQMAALYSLADFYISASHCEGLNLPLLEAMSFGTVPIATRNTAMLDYLDAENAVIIAEKSYPGLVPGMAGDIAGAAYDVSVATRFDVARAIRRAQALSGSEYAEMAARAGATVADNYSEDRVIGLASARLNLIGQDTARKNVA